MANAPFSLFCSTPPPIDDELDASPVNDDDDFGDFADAYPENLNNYMENTGDDDFSDFHSGVPQFLGHVSNEPSKAHTSNAERDFNKPNIPKTDLNCDFINANDIEILKKNENENPNKSIPEVDFDSQMTNDHTASLSSLSEQQTSSATSISPVSKSPPPRIETGLDAEDKDFGEFQFDKSIEVAKSDSGRSTENDSISNDAVDKLKELPNLSNDVVLEDLVDDSSDDERLSSRNRKNLNFDESSSEFFAIHPVEETCKEAKDVQDSVGNAGNNVDNDSLAMSATETEAQLPVPPTFIPADEYITSSEVAVPPTVTNDEIQIYSTQQETVADTNLSKLNITCHNKMESGNYVEESSPDCEANMNDSDDDFANFQDFSSAPVMQSTWPISTEIIKQETSESALHKLPESSETNSIVATKEINETLIEDKDNDDDDDFGDFSEAPILATSPVQISTQSAIPVLSEQLKPILKIMFPSVSAITGTVSLESTTSQQQSNNTINSAPMELAFVESAKALEYQWTGSIVRHAFIKSLGIDSRNIFLTEKWNPAMPRFAANLSFDPLQPLKPTSVPLQPENVSSTANSSKADVPVAEFDWKSSGLVNPLDASHVHTLLLDVDQLVVVANLDNINLDSSSSCSQSSSSTSICTLTTATSTSTYINKTNNTNGKMVTTTETASSKMMSKIHNTNADNGTIVNAFHGDNLQLNSIDYDTLCTDSNASGTTFQCRTNNIIDLHDTGNVNVLLSTTVDISQNNCNIPHPSHYHNYNNNINNINVNNNKNNNYNNNNNANTSLAVLNPINTIRFDASVTTASASAFNLLLPNTSAAFTNNLPFNELHHSLAGQISSNLTPKSSSTITTTTTTTTTNPTITEITNIVHHFKKMQMQMSTVSTSQCLNTNLYREPRPQTEMASQPIDASKAESSFASVIESDGNASTGSTDASTEASAVAASTAGGALPSTLTGGGNTDSSDNTISNNIDIGLYDTLNSKSSTELPKEVVCTQVESLNMDEHPTKADKDIKVLDAVGCVTNESSISLDVYNMEGDAEVRIENGVISRSTFAGPLKETHIFTPSKNMPDLYDKNLPTLARTVSPATTGCAPKVFPVDFDYEKAAAGIIIDETVVHKEYRDVEYNPGFGFDGSHMQRVESPAPKPLSTLSNTSSTQPQQEDFDDEFTDFQSVPPPEPMRTTAPRVEKLSKPTPVNSMILSPAILLPQAISIESKQPKIEWGDSATNIDPDELARIEQLFPQDINSRSSSKKSSPTHAAMHSTSLSISASIANKTQEHVVDDDDWSDFVSVPVPATNKLSQRSPQKSKLETNDDEWSDFVSSAPNMQPTVAPNHRVAHTAASYAGMPQFNSASWQNANFYNNPLSVYHRNQINAVPNATPTKLQNNNYSNHNNNNNQNNHHNNRNNGNNNFTQYLSNNSTTQKLPQQQKIQVMQDFSTASSDFTQYRPRMPQSNYAGPTNTHFQVGSAKVAPTVSLIPDLGFVAPAMPVHTAIINALPKPSTNSKK